MSKGEGACAGLCWVVCSSWTCNAREVWRGAGGGGEQKGECVVSMWSADGSTCRLTVHMATSRAGLESLAFPSLDY